MKKKLLLIFLFLLIVIFLILFLFKEDNINEIINNTLNKKDEYKLTLSIKNIYKKDKELTSKIKYIEEKKDKLYRFTSKIYQNGTLMKENITFLDDKTFYYKDSGSYKSKVVEDANEVKDFNIDYISFFTKINRARKIKSSGGKKIYVTKMNSEDAFSLIYDNPENKDLEMNTDVYLVINNNELTEIYYTINDKTNNTYSVDLELDFGIQNIELELN